ncbi:MAG: L,D-transpeptidase [Rhodovulum sp.]|nr:L,D-transpeptidase [Rhodovulum sp.]
MTRSRVQVRPALLAAALVTIPLAAAPLDAAEAALLVSIHNSSQRMTVVVDGAPRYSWPVSTGRAGYSTPNGTFSPTRMHRSYFSRKYYNSPMPYSIFFHGGYAIHGSYEIARLGGPASHGCVRLHPSNAATLFSLVKQHGTGSTRIVVTGAAPAGPARAPREMAPVDDEPVVSYRPVNPYGAYGGTYYQPYQPAQPYAPRPYPGGYAPYRWGW